ncbi:MAG TPA: hypothetical protein VF530_20185 [Planctomycetota bacterium]
MKLLLIPVLLAGVGAGWFGLRAEATPEVAPADGPLSCPAEDCRVTVECTERDTCLVTCTDANDEIVCQQEIPCDAPCDKVCEKPCEGPGAKVAPASGCAVPCAK